LLKLECTYQILIGAKYCCVQILHCRSSLGLGDFRHQSGAMTDRITYTTSSGPPICSVIHFGNVFAGVKHRPQPASLASTWRGSPTGLNHIPSTPGFAVPHAPWGFLKSICLAPLFSFHAMPCNEALSTFRISGPISHCLRLRLYTVPK